jgi:hypothetical protein
MVSGTHWESQNVFSSDKGKLLYLHDLSTNIRQPQRENREFGVWSLMRPGDWKEIFEAVEILQ